MLMELVDTHAHLTYEPLAGQLEQVLSRSRLVGVRRWITVGTSPEDNERAVELACRIEGLRAAVGYHPHYADEIGEAELQMLRRTAAHPRAAAVGETGLDYYYHHSQADNQRRIFRAQLEIAAELQKPAVIHIREAFEEAMSILEEYRGRLPKVVIHCYSGNLEQTAEVERRGYFVSFTGIITFKKAEEARRAAARFPLERVMIETDCPYLSPEPVRKIQPNEPALLIHTAAKLAEVYGLSLDQFARRVTAVSMEFFGLE
jgi:TatD DNase family protein